MTSLGTDIGTIFREAERHLHEKNDTDYETHLFTITQKEHKNENELKIIDDSFTRLATRFVEQKNAARMKELMDTLLNRINVLPKAKAAKLAKYLMDQGAKLDGFDEWQIGWAERLRQWCTEQVRTFLRQRVDIRIATLFWKRGDYRKALDLLEPMAKEVRKVDDKHLLVEVELLESRIYHSLEFLSRAKSTLTAARAAANSIYCPPLLQAELDLMSGILIAEEKDYKTAYSYFFESFEAFNGLDKARAIYPLKYMILCKVMMNAFDEVSAILGGKHGLEYAGPDLLAMREITQAHKHKSLREFNDALQKFHNEIQGDSILRLHIKSLYESLIEQNLFKIVEPYSKVQISFISKQIGLAEGDVQAKLSEMILDKKFNGTLDQGNGCLIIFSEDKVDNLFETSMATMSSLNVVIDKLFDKAKLVKS